MSYDFNQILDRRSTESSKWHKYGPDILPLWVADMDFRSPEPVIQALRERIEHGVFGYGRELPEFNACIVERMQHLYGWKIAPEAILPIPGVVPGFNVACKAMTVPGDGVLMQTPIYPPILRCPDNFQLRRDATQLVRQADGQYTIDFEALRAAITPRTRVFLLCNPHNPVGRVFSRDELSQMAEICLQQNMIICSDEIHSDLIFSGHQHTPIAALSPEVEARTITFIAPSKTYNLAGFKCAVAIIPDAQLRNQFMAARGDLVQPMVNIIGYLAALVAYRDGQPWLEEVLGYLEGNRNFVDDYVHSRFAGVTTAPPEGTYLSWLDCRQANLPQNDPYTFFLEKAKVALNDGITFGPGGTGFVRLNFGCPRPLLQQALQQMEAALSQR